MQEDDLAQLMLHYLYSIIPYLMTVGLSQLRAMPCKGTAHVPQRPNWRFSMNSFSIYQPIALHVLEHRFNLHPLGSRLQGLHVEKLEHASRLITLRAVFIWITTDPGERCITGENLTCMVEGCAAEWRTNYITFLSYFDAKIEGIMRSNNLITWTD